MGCTLVGIADNGESGKALIERERPDIIITDIRMPKLDGFGMVDQTRAVVPDAVIVMLSGYDDFDYALKSINRHVFEYLLKPAKISEVRNTLIRATVEAGQRKRFKEIQHQSQLMERKSFMLDALNGVVSKSLDVFREEGNRTRCMMHVFQSLDGEKLPTDEMTALCDRLPNQPGNICLTKPEQFLYFHFPGRGPDGGSLHRQLAQIIDGVGVGYLSQATERPVTLAEVGAAYRTICARLDFERFTAFDRLPDADLKDCRFSPDLDGLCQSIADGTDDEVEVMINLVLAGMVKSSDYDIMAVCFSLYALLLRLAQMNDNHTVWELRDVAQLRDFNDACALVRDAIERIRSRDQADEPREVSCWRTAS